MKIFAIIMELILLTGIVAFDGLMFTMNISFWAELLFACVGTGFGLLLMLLVGLDFIEDDIM